METNSETTEANREASPETNSEANLVPLTKHITTKADQRTYNRCLKEIHADIEIVEQALLRLTRNLKIVSERRLYFCGGYTTFEEFCRKELGKSRQQAYHLIHAYDLMQNLLEAGVAEEDLPPTERLCRELRRLPTEYHARVWKIVQRAAKDKGRRPEVGDIQEAATKELDTPAAVDRQQNELLQKFEGMARKLKVGLDPKILSPVFRTRLMIALAEIADTATQLMATLRHHEAAEDTESEEEADAD
jgi:hypothetical protein